MKRSVYLHVCPTFQVPADKTHAQIITEEAQNGLKRRLARKEEEGIPFSQEAIEEYHKRLDFELGVIIDKGLSAYFLALHDIISYAHKSQIPVGPGRGAAVGSLATYCLTITNIDPISYGLLFERFLNPLHPRVPDIYIDFCTEGIDEAIKYAKKQYEWVEMDEDEHPELMKFCFSALKDLTVMKHTLTLIEKETGEAVDIERISLNDKETYRLLGEGKTTGVFEMDSDIMKDLLKRVKPDVFEDIVALMALERPGPIESGMVDDFIKSKHGEIKITYLLSQLEEILTETYGVIVYQEQVMRIAQALANYTLAEAGLLWETIARKKFKEIARQKELFLAGTSENGLNIDEARHVYELMEEFASFCFIKSHSVACARIAYQAAFLKANYPVQFMAALERVKVPSKP